MATHKERLGKTDIAPTQKQLSEAWEFVRKMREEWTEQDWQDFYEGIAFAFFKIQRRHEHKKKPAEDYQI